MKEYIFLIILGIVLVWFLFRKKKEPVNINTKLAYLIEKDSVNTNTYLQMDEQEIWDMYEHATNPKSQLHSRIDSIKQKYSLT